MKLLDENGETVATGQGTTCTLHLDKAYLWDGIENPYLYTLVAELTVAGEVTDRISCKAGIREFSFDPKKGFFLNGRSYPLRGVSRHQDWKDIGNAITRENMDTDMELIREVGANTVRLAHYQHDQYFYDLCDKYGLIVWAEIPYISEHLPNGRENTFSQMKELIAQNHHHPSIVMWGVSNEITISGNQPKNRADMLDNHHELQKLCKEMDPTRSTTSYADGMNWVVIVLFCVIPMLAWIATLWAMKGYTLTGLRMKEIQAVNAKRKAAIEEGMSLEEAMRTYQ